MRVSVCLRAILIPEYLDFHFQNIFQNIFRNIPNERALRELKQPQRRQPLQRHIFAYLTKKKNKYGSFARFTRALFIFEHLASVLVLSTT